MQLAILKQKPGNIFSPGHWRPLIRRLPAKGGAPRIALSFDDGPTPETTPALIELLGRYNARATFFLSGVRVAAHPGLVRDLVAAGHAVYGHGWEHIRLDQAGPERLYADLEKAEAALRPFRPTPSPCLVRLPYAAGRRTGWVHKTIGRWNKTAQIAHWSHSSHDWDIAPGCASMPELEQACRATVDTLAAQPKLDGGILLLHEAPFDRDAPLNAAVAPILVEMLLKHFSAKGFSFVTIEPWKRRGLLSRFVLA